jgi:hypothetical protein
MTDRPACLYDTLERDSISRSLFFFLHLASSELHDAVEKIELDVG